MRIDEIFEQETWFTENTQIRTPTGWQNIYELELGEPILIYTKGKVVTTSVSHIAKVEYDGVVSVYKDQVDTEINAKNLITNCKTILYNQEYEVREQKTYKGNLYHIRSPYNNIIVRIFKYFHSHNHDYTIAPCLVK